MAKLKRTKKDKKLRQSIEVLKAQLKTSDVIVEKATSAQKSKSYAVIDSKAIKADLLKTVTLSVIAFSVILTIKLLDINPF